MGAVKVEVAVWDEADERSVREANASARNAEQPYHTGRGYRVSMKTVPSVAAR